MSHPPPSRLAALPGYDTAPDIYETPDVAEATDTTVNTSRSPSPEEDDDSQTTDTEDDEEEDEEGDGEHAQSGVVSRRRMNVSKARRRFDLQGRGVRTASVNLGDGIGGGRRGYGLRYKGAEVENEGLESRVARLRREVEECRVLAAESEGKDEGGVGEEVRGLQALLARLDGEVAERRRVGSGTAAVKREAPGTTDGPRRDEVDLTDEQMLSRVADFDARLAGLETALGLSALDAQGADAAAPLPLLPSLTVLDQQLSALGSASSTANLEAASARLQRLRAEAESTLSQSAVNGASEPDADHETTFLTNTDRETLTKLYALLPTLHSLSPTVPSLLTRLRSLRTLHINAANAASALEDLEKRQAEMDRELELWRQGLEKVEGAVKKAHEANGRNGTVVQGWVEDLEKRMQALGRF